MQKHGHIAVHRAECPLLAREDGDALISAGWESTRQRSLRSLCIRAHDRAGVIYKISKVMRDLNVSIHNIAVQRNTRTARAEIRVDMEPITGKAYSKIVARLRGIKEVEGISDADPSA